MVAHIQLRLVNFSTKTGNWQSEILLNTVMQTISTEF